MARECKSAEVPDGRVDESVASARASGVGRCRRTLSVSLLDDDGRTTRGTLPLGLRSLDDEGSASRDSLDEGARRDGEEDGRSR